MPRKKPEPLAESLRLQKAAAREGFDWPRAELLWAKLREETLEFREVAHQRVRGEEELGDLLFMAVNLARHYGLDPARALRGGNAKFMRRYGYVMKHAASLPPRKSKRRLAEMEKLWQKAKRQGL